MIPFIYKIFRKSISPSPIPEKIPNIQSIHLAKETQKINDRDQSKKEEASHPINYRAIPKQTPKEGAQAHDEFTPHAKEDEFKTSISNKPYDSHFTNHLSQPEKPIIDLVSEENDNHKSLASLQFKLDLPNGSFIHCLLHWDPMVQNAWIQISSENMELLGNFSQIKHGLIDDIKKVGFLEVYFEIIYE